MYIVYNALVEKENRLEQKDFVLGVVENLQQRATALNYYNTRSSHEKQENVLKDVRNTSTRRRLNHKAPHLPKRWLEGPSDSHMMVSAKKRSTCKYCSYLALKHRADGKTGDPPKVSNVYGMCSKCKVHLCSMHFNAYHNHHDSSDSDDSSKNVSIVVGV